MRVRAITSSRNVGNRLNDYEHNRRLRRNEKSNNDESASTVSSHLPLCFSRIDKYSHVIQDFMRPQQTFIY